MEDDPKKYKGPKPGKFFTTGLVIAVVLLIALTAGLVLGHDLIVRRQTSELEQRAQQGVNVLVAKVFEQPSSQTFNLPATIHGYIEAPIYAKVAGYLKTINVDKGDRIKQGQVLALLDTPDLDKQVADAKANYLLQKVTDKREQELVKAGVISQQAADNSHYTMLQAKATYEQLLAEQNYKVIYAPVDGIITARYVDPGALIPEAINSTSGSGVPILAVATLSPLRVYIDAPQSVALSVKNGDAVVITADEIPGRKFIGTVVRHPEALNSASRTMLVEVDLQNEDHSLYPGMYAKMAVTVAAAHAGQMVRDDALVFRDGKVLVPVVRGDKLHLVEVKLGYDNGQMVAIDGDVHSNDLVALNVGQAAQDGAVVHPVYAQQQ